MILFANITKFNTHFLTFCAVIMLRNDDIFCSFGEKK